MEDDKQVLKGGLILLGVAIVLLAAWRVLSYKPNATLPQPKTYPSSENNQKYKAELLEEPHRNTTSSTSSPFQLQQKVSPNQQTVVAQKPMDFPVRREEKSILQQQETPGISSRFESPLANKPRRLDGGLSFPARTGNVSYTPTSSASSNPMLAALPTGGETYTPAASTEGMSPWEQRMLAPYLVPDKETQKKLDNNLQYLHSSIAQAVQSALMPKSKKTANIEKYLHKGNSSTTTATAITDPFQTLLAQMDTQKKEMVQSTTQAFGKQAGQEVGLVMDNFRKDLTTEISKADQAPQTTAKNIQKIAQTYEQKLAKMNEKNQYEQYVKNRTEDYQNQVKDLAKRYPDNQSLIQTFDRISQEALEKELSLPSQKLSSEEYEKARYDIQYTMRQQFEEAAKKAGVSTAGLHAFDNDRAQQILSELQQQEEKGLRVSIPRKSSVDDANGLSNTLLKEKKDMLEQVEKAYGTEAYAQFKSVLDKYYQDMMETTQQELTDSKRQQKQMELRLDANRKILEMQKEAIKKMNLPEEQKKQSLQTIEKELQSLPTL